MPYATLVSARHFSAIVCVGLVYGAASAAGTSAQSTPRASKVDGHAIVFDYAPCLESKGNPYYCQPTYTKKASDGDIITLAILNIGDTTKFTFSASGIPIPKPDVVTSTTPVPHGRGITKIVVTLTQVHDAATYSGYVFRATPKDATGDKLFESKITVKVITREWTVSFAGGFTGSTLNDPEYAVKDKLVQASTGGPTYVRPTFIEEHARENAVNLGLAAFVHTYLSSWPHIGLSFGLGVQQTGTTYYFGPSWLIGKVADLTAGAAIGSIKAPPSGVSVGD